MKIIRHLTYSSATQLHGSNWVHLAMLAGGGEEWRRGVTFFLRDFERVVVVGVRSDGLSISEMLKWSTGIFPQHHL